MTIGFALRHHCPWLIATVFLCLVLAVATDLVQTPTYQATSTVQIDTNDAVGQGSIDVTSQETRATQLIDRLESQPFLSGVCARPALKDTGCGAAALQKQVSASLDKSTTMVAISVSAAQPRSAATLANQIADQVVYEQGQQAAAFYAGDLKQVNTQLAQLSAQIAAQEAQISAITGEPGLDDAQREEASAPYVTQVDALQSSYSAAYGNLLQLQQDQLAAQSSVTVAQVAQTPSAPAEPDLPRYLAAGAAAGLVIGFLLMLLMARLDGRVREGATLGEAADLPFVFEMPRGQSLTKTVDRTAAGVAALLAGRPDIRSVLLVATDKKSDAGRSAVVLGEVLHTLGRDTRVVIEDALEPASGRRAANRSTPDTVSSATALSVLPPISAHTAGAEPAGLVLLGAARPDRSPLALLVAAKVDLIVLVGSQDDTQTRVARRAAALLRQAGGELVAGLLLTGVGRLPQPLDEQPALVQPA